MSLLKNVSSSASCIPSIRKAFMTTITSDVLLTNQEREDAEVLTRMKNLIASKIDADASVNLNSHMLKILEKLVRMFYVLEDFNSLGITHAELGLARSDCKAEFHLMGFCAVKTVTMALGKPTCMYSSSDETQALIIMLKHISNTAQSYSNTPVAARRKTATEDELSKSYFPNMGNSRNITLISDYLYETLGAVPKMCHALVEMLTSADFHACTQIGLSREAFGNQIVY